MSCIDLQKHLCYNGSVDSLKKLIPVFSPLS
nr:MAG TPA: hypothetical protein [Bacteriophage sp.]